MKFRYIGEDYTFCLELCAFNIKGEHGEYLFKGDTVDVPNNNKIVINALDKSAVFERVVETKKIKKQIKEEK